MTIKQADHFKRHLEHQLAELDFLLIRQRNRMVELHAQSMKRLEDQHRHNRDVLIEIYEGRIQRANEEQQNHVETNHNLTKPVTAGAEAKTIEQTNLKRKPQAIVPVERELRLQVVSLFRSS